MPGQSSRRTVRGPIDLHATDLPRIYSTSLWSCMRWLFLVQVDHDSRLIGEDTALLELSIS